jgi:hypothetical protein
MTLRQIVFSAALLIGLLALASTAALRAQQARAMPTDQPAANGRYQVVVSTVNRADVFLLDTRTGKIWIPTEYTSFEGNPKAWTYQERIDDQAAEVAWERTLKPRGRP